MIINDSNKIIYLGNGATKEWPFSFSITQASDIKVSLVNLDGEILNISSDYYVDITNKKVLYPGYVPGQEPSQAEQPPILPTGWKIIIYRSVPVTQETDLGTNWPFNIIEKGFDKLTMIIQDLQEELSRAVKVEISSSTSPEELLDVIKQSRDIAVQAAKDAKRVAEETVKKVEEQLNEKVEIAQSAAENAANKAVENVEKQLNDEVIAAQFSAQTATEKAEIAILTANDITKKMEVAQDTVEKAKLQANRAESEADRAEKMANAFDMTNYYQKAKTDELLSKKQDYYSGNIKVGGDANKFYPVAFRCSNGNDGKPFQVNIRRPKHMDAQDTGFLDFEMGGCGSSWGSTYPNIYTRYYSVVDFVADAKPAARSTIMHVWLKGGGITYYWGGTHPIFSSDIDTTDSVTIQNDTLTPKTVCTLPKGVSINGVNVATTNQVVRTDADSVMDNSSTPKVIHGATGKDWGLSWNPVALVAYDWTNSRTIWNYNPSTSHLALMPTSGIVTSPTPESTDNSTKVATTAFVQTVSKANGGIVASSLAETGWGKYANGLIEQWGYATVGAGSTATITLPILLTSTIYNIQVSPNNTTVDSRGDKQDWVGASPASLNAIVIRNGFEHNISSSKIWWKVMGV